MTTVDPILDIRVYGAPAPQGSKRAVVHKQSGKAVVMESSKRVKPWREAVTAAALATGAADRPPYDGPVIVTMVFSFERPKSHFLPANTRRPSPVLRPDAPPRPAGAPDLSKLLRSTEDALTHVVLSDDARIVEFRRPRKVWVGEDPWALDRPGARILIEALPMKTCTGCGRSKPLTAFSVDRHRRDGRQVRCKQCQTIARAEHRARDPERARTSAHANYVRTRERHRERGRAAHLRRKFGMSPEQYAVRLSDQGGMCRICGAVPRPGRALPVDHDHSTGKVRGLLCDRCNRLIGLAGDDPAVLTAAARYLAGPDAPAAPPGRPPDLFDAPPADWWAGITPAHSPSTEESQ